MTMKFRTMIICGCLAHLLIVLGMCSCIFFHSLKSFEYSVDDKGDDYRTNVSNTNYVEVLDWLKMGGNFVWWDWKLPTK